jgi:hypothetical protein
VAEGARLLSECGGKLPPRVRIPLSPPGWVPPGTGPSCGGRFPDDISVIHWGKYGKGRRWSDPGPGGSDFPADHRHGPATGPEPAAAACRRFPALAELGQPGGLRPDYLRPGTHGHRQIGQLPVTSDQLSVTSDQLLVISCFRAACPAVKHEKPCRAGTARRYNLKPITLNLELFITGRPEPPRQAPPTFRTFLRPIPLFSFFCAGPAREKNGPGFRGNPGRLWRGHGTCLIHRHFSRNNEFFLAPRRRCPNHLIFQRNPA